MTVLAGAVAAALAACSGYLISAPRTDVRRRLLRSVHQRRSPGSASLLAVALVGLSIWLFVGDLFGALLGGVVAWWLRRWLQSVPTSRQIAEARRRAAELPVAVDLLSACLASGAPTLRALQVVGPAIEPSLDGDLRRVAAALQIGAVPDEAWSLVAATEFAPVAVIMRRSAVSGAPVAERLSALAGELRSQLRSQALTDARALGVRTAGPLGVCFLPAFILIGVIPLVASLVGEWL